MYEKPTSQSYYEKLIETTNLNWKEIYNLPRKASIEVYFRSFLLPDNASKNSILK